MAIVAMLEIEHEDQSAKYERQTILTNTAVALTEH
jgi:hypothetical protein